MVKKYFGDKNFFYKGNLHRHTTNFDGQLTPEQFIILTVFSVQRRFRGMPHNRFSDQENDSGLSNITGSGTVLRLHSLLSTIITTVACTAGVLKLTLTERK